jgi:hypothetical protein
MNRHLQTPSEEVEWTVVSPSRPCRVCGADHGCRLGYKEEFACCSRQVSDWPLTNGGWLHRLVPHPDEESRVA